MASIKDVADRAGVSIATVSRVMNRRGALSEKTISKVQEAMKDLHYQPNDLARALSGKKESKIIALLSLPLQHPFYSELITNIEECLFREGYKLLIITSFEDIIKEENCVNLVQSHMIDGLIIGGHPASEKILYGSPITIVTVEASLPDIPYVISDNNQGGIMAARYLIARGCRHLVHIGGDMHHESESDRRTRAFEEVCAAEHIPCTVYESTAGMLRNMDYSAVVSRMLFEHPEADGVFASSDVIAAEVIRVTGSMGIRVPDQLKVIGFDNVRMARLMNPPLTTIGQDFGELAQQTVQKILKQIHGETVEMRTVIPVTLVERQSV